ncbi:MAG: DUF5018 domain-containing protein, partial [Candidatus Staskawiczbacteria bacterium]|nr:DUF5018 domain-containing protein [Candidatus Staskawiczbacteria bacterium]
YFVISLLIATVFCYVIFWAKNNFQRQEITTTETALKTVGTKDQKNEESEVINYQQKINDFAQILKNHEFASHAFAFMEEQTMPNIWFRQFGMAQKDSSLQLSGEADSLDALSRQIAAFEKNEYVANLGSLNSTLNQSGRIDFSFNLGLDPKIFNFSSAVSLFQTAASSSELISPVIPAEGLDQNGNPINNVLPSPQAGASQKLITSFHLLLEPEVIGIVDQDKHTINLDVPFGTNVKNITPVLVYSPEAKVSPDSNVAQDFTSPVAYKVTAADGSEQDYVAKVNILPKGGVQNKTTKSNSGIIITIIAFVAIVVIAAIIFIVWKKMQKKKLETNNHAN